MIVIGEYSYYLYLCKIYLYFYTKQNKKAMKTLKKRILKPLLFVCLGLSIAIITFASDLPSPPGRPSPFDIEADRCKLRFKEPIRSGASRIQRYRIEYQSEKKGRWLLERTISPQFSIDGIMQSDIDNRVEEGDPVIFRVFAQNLHGRGAPSETSNSIIFRDPFK